MASTSSSLPQTFQLPDTLSIIADLELSANQHCRAACDASIAFTSKLGLPDLNSLFFQSQEDKEKDADDQEDRLKLGLLTSLIFPRADLPQLVLLTDFMQLLVWSCIVGSERNASPDAAGQPPGQRGLDVLEEHPYFKHLSPRLKRYARSSSVTWKKSFEQSFKTFYEAQQVLRNDDEEGGKFRKWAEARHQSSKPRVGVDTSRKADSSKARNEALDEHLKFRRNMYGVDMLMSLAELVEVVPAFDEMSEDLMNGNVEYEEKRGSGTFLTDAEMNLVRGIREHALDFMGMAIDALSFRYLHFNNIPIILPNSGATQSLSPSEESSSTSTTNINPYLPYTFIPHIMMHNSLSLQGAMNHSVTILNAEFARFKEASEEKKMLEVVERESQKVRRVKTGGSSGWGIGDKVMGVIKLLGGSTSGNDLSGDPCCDNGDSVTGDALQQHYLSSEARLRRKARLTAYVRALEDMIVGSINWAYESELFFGGGNKGAEVRAFGWVFG